MFQLRLLAVLLALAPSAFAQGTAEFPSPFRAAPAASGQSGRLSVVLDAELHAALRQERRVLMRDFALPGNRSVDLELEQRSWRGTLAAPTVDGIERMDLYLGHDLTTWRGRVLGDPQSTVYLGFSRHGSSGFVRFAGGLVRVSGQPGPDGDRSAGHAVLVDSGLLGSFGSFDCGTEAASVPAQGGAPAGKGSASSGLRTGSNPLPLATSAQHARQAVSVDYWVYQNFGSNLNAEIAHIYQLLWSVADFYYSELAHPALDFILTMPYIEFWTVSGDPWTECDTAGDTKSDVLDEFEDKWDDIFDQKKTQLALLLCGKSIGGGKASGAGLSAAICPGVFAGLGEHSVAGSIDDETDFPIVQDSDNWPFVVIAHEIGHNIGGIHTHDNDLDSCDDEDPGNCPEGTIMSYCHLCSGSGVSNIDISFHPVTKSDIWSNLDDQDCLPLIGIEPIHVKYPLAHSEIPDGSPVRPYPNLFEGLLLSSLLGGPADTVRLEGALPGNPPGQAWPAIVIDEVLLIGGGVQLEGFFLGSGATIGQ